VVLLGLGLGVASVAAGQAKDSLPAALALAVGIAHVMAVLVGAQDRQAPVSPDTGQGNALVRLGGQAVRSLDIALNNGEAPKTPARILTEGEFEARLEALQQIEELARMGPHGSAYVYVAEMLVAAAGLLGELLS
jgi:hypothetical protein